MKIFNSILLIQLANIFYGVKCALNLPIRQTSETVNEEAISGIQRVYDGDNFPSQNLNFNDQSIMNKAHSVNRIANSGSRLIFSNGSVVSDSNLNMNAFVSGNVASSDQREAISGSQVVLDTIQNSEVNELSSVFNNKAIVTRAVGTSEPYSQSQLYRKPYDLPYPSAIGGIQTLVYSMENTTVTLANTAVQNNATNMLAGKALSGVDQAFKYVEGSDVVQQNTARDNSAYVVNGTAVSGVKMSSRNLSDTNMRVEGKSTRNEAYATGGNAVAGVENNFGFVSGAEIVLDSSADFNIANATNGQAVGGVAINIVGMNQSTLISQTKANNNDASSHGQGRYPKDSTAGVSIKLLDIQNTNMTLDFNASENQAFNYHKDPALASHAISGIQVLMGTSDNAMFDITGDVSNNYATAKYGDAIAGTRLHIVNVSDSTSVKFAVRTLDNKASADNGDAVVLNSFTVGDLGRSVFSR